MSKIKNSQMRFIFGKLKQAEETAWRDEYVFEASNQRVTSVADLSIEEANVMLNLLDQVLKGQRKPFNTHSFLASNFGKVHKEAPTESNQDKTNRLRRNILRYCHEMGTWYQKDKEQNIILKNGKPLLDYTAIDNFCLTHSASKKKLNDQSSAELTKTIYQFKKMASMVIYKA